MILPLDVHNIMKAKCVNWKKVNTISIVTIYEQRHNTNVLDDGILSILNKLPQWEDAWTLERAFYDAMDGKEIWRYFQQNDEYDEHFEESVRYVLSLDDKKGVKKQSKKQESLDLDTIEFDK